MTLPSVYKDVATHVGYCNGCDDERPLMVMEHGPRGLRAWLGGVGPDDRTLSYTCLACGRVEHVPHADAEDEYAATLPTWPDWMPVVAPVAAQAPAPLVVLPGDVFALAATRIEAEPVLVAPVVVAVPVAIRLPAARTHTVRVITLPMQRVSATDEHLLALSA